MRNALLAGLTALLLAGTAHAQDQSLTRSTVEVDLEANAEAGDLSAMYQLGRQMVRGEEGVDTDPVRGMEMLRIAADGGEINAQILAGDILIRGLYGISPDVEAGRRYLEEAGEYRADATVRLGEYLMRGVGVDRNVPLGLSMLERAAANGEMRAAMLLGDSIIRGDVPGLPADPARGAMLLERAANSGLAEAMGRYGNLLLRGEDLPLDAARGISLLERASARGYTQADYLLGAFFLRGNDQQPADVELALTYLDRGAASGDVMAMGLLGDSLLRNLHGQSDPERGRRLLETAIEGGNVRAGFLLGQALQRQAKTDQERSEAIGIIEDAAAAGSAEAMANLGDTLLRAQGEALDVDRGMGLLEDAVGAGDARAAQLLGDIYLRGLYGQSRDTDRAIALFEQASDGGWVTATRMLGESFLRGTGVTQDVERGLGLLQEAAEAGDYRAAYRLGDAYLRRPEIVQSDETIGLEWLEQAVAANDNEAISLKGEWLMTNGGEARQAEGVELLRTAAANGNIRANYLLGNAYLGGLYGIEADAEQGRAMISTAAEAGDGWAMIRLAGLHLNGVGVPVNVDEAEDYYRRALESGTDYAAVPLANIYLGGRRGERDVETGLGILEDEAQSGNVEAIRQLLTIYGDGRWQVAEPDADRWNGYYRLLQQHGSAEQIAAEDAVEVLRRASQPAAFADPVEVLVALPRDLRNTAFSRLVTVNPNAYVYAMQSLLQRAGRFDGSLSGILNAGTIRAINAACRETAGFGCGDPMTAATAIHLSTAL